MVDTKFLLAGVAAAFIGGYYFAFSKAGTKMCTDPNFSGQMSTFSTACPNINTYELLKYYTL